jgi:hypothetical protein
MINFRNSALFLLAIFSILSVGACVNSTIEPTLDPNMIYTEAAKTVSAQLTAEVPPTEAASPTAPPTNTPVPATNTPIPERATETPLPTATPAEAITNTPQPTATAKSSGDELIDEALFITFYPPTDQIFTSGGTFDAQVGFRNVGPNTWNGGYSMRFLSGNTLGVGSKYTIDDYALKDSVAPGEDVVITIPGMTAPAEEGRYLSNWCFYNNREDQGLRPQCFFLVTFQIIVSND